MVRLTAMQRAFCSAPTCHSTSAGCVRRNGSRGGFLVCVFVRILCSDLLRARMTAAALAVHSGIVIEESPLLQERNFGDLRGVPYAELAANPFGPDFVPPNG